MTRPPRQADIAQAGDPGDPYAITGPALVSFSGGRTSAFMLWHILQAHGGTLPDDVVVAFANTGKEREETLRFVHECGERWGVRIVWLEWRQREKPCFDVVSHNSASRNGEPFAELIRRKKFVPNSQMRFCTEELKVRVLREFCQSLGWTAWSNVIGLRYDEGHRVMKALARNDEGGQTYTTVMPMAKAKHTRRDVMEFWKRQPFDLGLRSYEGNCDLCFLKGRPLLAAIIREAPHRAEWWMDQEEAAKGSFRKDTTYLETAVGALSQTHMLGILDGEHDAECGLLCGVDE
jgi:3'-phosphoadenosine 5'-phosphosulfate sulfotransferase (PAPS reductase)/FAD synthetase